MTPHVCFVAPKAYPVLSGKRHAQHIGGAEVQQVHIARGLVERDYRVSFVTLDVGQPDGEDLNGIKVYRSYRLDAGWPGLRFFHPRLTRDWAAMRRADADIYYQRTGDTLTGLVAGSCRRRRRSFVFAVGNEGDCDPALSFCSSFRERIPYRWGLRRADAVVAQTQTQKRNLRHHFGVEAQVIPSCTVSPPSSTTKPRNPRPRVIWLGRFAPEKQLEVLLQVAARCGSVDFDVLGDGPATPYVQNLRDQALRFSNVRLLGYVPHAELSRHYDEATALICTSRTEGFPNTFLEAWSRRLPVITSIDPDDVVKRHGLGIVRDTSEALSNAVNNVCFDGNLRTRLSDSAYEHFLTHHTMSIAVDAYDRLFRSLLNQDPRPRTHADLPHDHGEMR